MPHLHIEIRWMAVATGPPIPPQHVTASPHLIPPRHVHLPRAMYISVDQRANILENLNHILYHVANICSPMALP